MDPNYRKSSAQSAVCFLRKTFNFRNFILFFRENNFLDFTSFSYKQKFRKNGINSYFFTFIFTCSCWWITLARVIPSTSGHWRGRTNLLLVSTLVCLLLILRLLRSIAIVRSNITLWLTTSRCDIFSAVISWNILKNIDLFFNIFKISL